MHDSIFTQIIKGDIPCHKIYEDDKTFAFLDIHPIQEGQVLVVPKSQVGFIWDLPVDDYTALMLTVRRVGKRIREVMPGKQRVGVMVEGLETTDHAHIKVFPFDDELEYRHTPSVDESPDHAALAALAQKLAF